MATKIHVVEGNRQKLDGGAMFGNAPKPLWERWHTPDDKNRIDLATRCLLVEREDRLILFEAGAGDFFPPELRNRYGIEEGHRLLHNLKELGIAPEDIWGVVLSHLHFDHCGGLLPSYGEPPRLIFPRAKFFVGKEHFARAKSPHLRDRASFIPEMPKLLEESSRLYLCEGSSHEELEGITLHYFQGHTPGMMVSEISLGEKTLFFVADLIPGASWVHLPIAMGYDRYPERTVEEKTQFLPKVAKENCYLFFTHDPKLAIAQARRKGAGQRFETISACIV